MDAEKPGRLAEELVTQDFDVIREIGIQSVLEEHLLGQELVFRVNFARLGEPDERPQGVVWLNELSELKLERFQAGRRKSEALSLFEGP